MWCFSMIKTKANKLRKMDIPLVLITVFLIFLTLITIFPLINILAISLSSASQAAKVVFIPKGFTLQSYAFILHNAAFWKAVGVSLMRIIIGPAVNLLFAIFPAYALSKRKKQFSSRTIYAWVFFISTIFGGGVIPWFMMIKTVGLYNSFWGLIIPGAVSAGNIILLLNFFRSIPVEMEEAAIMDGASQFRILIQIYLPLSKAAIATILLFSIVGHWNGWFDGMVLLKDPNKYPLQTYLQSIVVDQPQMSTSNNDWGNYDLISQKTTNAAQIFISILPMIILYPFFQKFFVKGLIIGGIKS